MDSHGTSIYSTVDVEGMRVGNLEKNPPMDQEILQKHQSDTDFVSYSQAGICDWPWWLEQVPTKYLPKWWLIIQGDLYNKHKVMRGETALEIRNSKKGTWMSQEVRING